MIDTHVHLYDTSLLRYDWVRGLGDLDRPHLLPEYLGAATAAGVTGFVFVDAGCVFADALAEAEWVSAQTGPDSPLLGIVAGAQVELDSVTDHLDRLGDLPLVSGVRRLIEPEPEIAASTAFRRGVRAAGARGYTFDLCCKAEQLPGVTDLVEACPDVQFVLDHLGKPDIAGGEWDGWAKHLTDLAGHDNVVAAKLSGLFSEGPADRCDRYLAHAIDVFGPDRLMVGGDWPVCEEAGTLAEWMDAVGRSISSLSESEQAAIGTGTATRVYRLGEGVR